MLAVVFLFFEKDFNLYHFGFFFENMSMHQIPGLDISNDPADDHECVHLFGESFSIPSNIDSMRSEGDFQIPQRSTDIHQLKAPITFIKGKDGEQKEISLVIYNEMQDANDELADILHELDIISKLNDNNVLKFYETIAGLKITDVAFVFEAHDSLLSEIIAKKIEKLYEPPVIKTIMRDLYSALCYLHDNRIVHRDIQPENIVFTSTGVLKVWNFRNAQRIGQKPKKLKVNEFRYQAIELILGSGECDESVDIWSANCIFAQLWLKKHFSVEHGKEKALECMFNLLGFPQKEIWKEFYNFPNVNEMLHLSEVFKYNMIDSCFKKQCDRPVPPNALELLHRGFRYNPKHRPSAEFCLLHPYFRETPKACRLEDIVAILDQATICEQLRAMKDKKAI